MWSCGTRYAWITNITVILRDLSHDFPIDIESLLVGPTGATVVLVGERFSGTSVTVEASLSMTPHLLISQLKV